jgi:hypothetical protein
MFLYNHCKGSTLRVEVAGCGGARCPPGGVLWSVGVTLAGYVLGASIPGIDQYLLPAIAVIVAVSAIPVAIEFARARRAQLVRHDRHRRTAVHGGQRELP